MNNLSTKDKHTYMAHAIGYLLWTPLL